METTLKWLQQYVDFKVSASELDELFTMSGTECEDMIPVHETGDTAFKFEITSNRTDCYGTLGLAREIAAILGIDFKMPDAEYATIGKDINSLTSVTLECPKLCPYYSVQLITGVKVQESPRWLHDYIETLASVKSIRPINNIADITNFVMLEYSQPLHAFDFDKLAEKRIVVRRARKGEKIHAIDDRDYELDTEMCVIADAENPQCVGGVMGGKNSEITEDSSSILLEAAYFSPMSIRRTSRKL
ncbi:MAG: phenylalanine--tRNA ligase subunit beta, partial [Candidatus Heimdallarchaeota archaeon]|nr:phenylalanine--tRNA ligase subunit beta [Candidatus Heimdallarchaeota archaeon]